MDWTSLGRQAAKTLLASSLHYSGARQALSHWSRFTAGGRRVLILSYHRVVEDFEQEARESNPGLLISKRTFERHLEELGRVGFEIVPLEEALDVVAGCGARARDVAVITFDDGYRDVFDHAFPVLKRQGIPATVYLASGYVGTSRRFLHDRLFHLLRWRLETGAAAVVDRLISRQPEGELERVVSELEQEMAAVAEPLPRAGEVLSWDMVGKMAAAGLSMGAHTVGHVVLTHANEQTLDRELSASKQEIEHHLGSPVRDFAYPNGYYDSTIIRALERYGFRSAVTTEDRPNTVGGNQYRLHRKTLWEGFSRGPWGYCASLTACHLDGVFTLLALTRPVVGQRERGGEARGVESSVQA